MRENKTFSLGEGMTENADLAFCPSPREKVEFQVELCET